jgi:hypothetical protein
MRRATMLDWVADVGDAAMAVVSPTAVAAMAALVPAAGLGASKSTTSPMLCSVWMYKMYAW